MISLPTLRLNPFARLHKQGRFALATRAYERGTVRLASHDLSGCAHLAATRHGLFAISATGHRLIAYGLFYGVTIAGDAIYAFEAGDRPRHPTCRGRIVRFRRAGDTIVDASVIVTGLDNGCHQIDVVRGELYVIDTYNQRIVAVTIDGSDVDGEDSDVGKTRILSPLPLAGDRYGPDYVHINSLIEHDGHVSLLLHNGGREGGGDERRSEVATFDADWTLVARTALDGHGCHSFAMLEDKTLLSCGSLAGELIGSNGLKLKLGEMMTRGLSVDATRILVGGSTFSTRDIRDEMGGAVYFLDRDYRLQATLTMPAPVMEIRRIDGQDRSLSSHLAAEARTGGPGARTVLQP